MGKQFSQDEVSFSLEGLSAGSFVLLRSEDDEEELYLLWSGAKYEDELFLILSKVEEYAYPMVVHYDPEENALENVDDEELKEFIFQSYLKATGGETLN